MESNFEQIEFLYYYWAKVVDVYDGDTITVEIDLGFTSKRLEKLRLAGINAPELKKEEREAGLKSRDILRKWILDKKVVVLTEKDKTGKYGRYIATVYYDGENINKKLVDQGYAEFREY